MGLFHIAARATYTKTSQLPISFMQWGPPQIFIESGLSAAQLSFFFVFLSNPSLSVSMFVLQLNSAFSRLLQSPSDLSALLWITTAPHFHCFRAICMQAAFTVCILAFLTCWIFLSASIHCTEFIHRPEHRARIRVSPKSNDWCTCSLHPPQVTCSFPNTWDRCQSVRLKKLPADGKSRMRGMPQKCPKCSSQHNGHTVVV